MEINAQRIELDDSAYRYIEDYLEHAASLLRFVLIDRDLAQGRVWTYLPHDFDISREALHQFDESMHPPPIFPNESLHYDASGNRVHIMPVETLDHLLVQVIQSHLMAGEDRICIFEAGERLSGGQDFGYLGGARLLEHGDEGYLLLTSDDASRPEHIRRTIKRTPSWLRTGILTSAPSSVHITNDKMVFTTKELRLLASATTAIIVGAYDIESYLVWWRGQ